MSPRGNAKKRCQSGFARAHSPGGSVHVLVTSDTLSGVWTYTRELVSGLTNRGHRVTLVSFGEIPFPQQTAWMDSLQGLEYHPTAFRLDWMDDGERAFADSSAYLLELCREVKPDLLHFNQLCYGALAIDIPRVVVAHGDMVSWWKAVHGHEPESSRWMRSHRHVITRGLAEANAVVAPTNSMLETIRASYLHPANAQVIPNGRNPLYFNPYVGKEDFVLAVGRIWDLGKQVSLLTHCKHPVPVCIVGSEAPPRSSKVPIRADVKLALDNVSISFKGPQSEAQLRSLYSRAAIYAATSRYDPTGISALEAALSRCAIVANDIPAFREVWQEDAVYFRHNDANSLAETIQKLSQDKALCRTYANRAYQRAREHFSAKRMVDQYTQLYHAVVQEESLAA
jgi:glycogen(starch) synthase